MRAKSRAPTIIKRKKVVAGGGHHGGVWKVSYADFVTAMLAFFVLMWPLKTTTEKQRKRIADSFSTNVPINRISGGGEGSFGGDSVFSEETSAQNGIGASLKGPTEARPAKGSTGFDGTEESGQADAAAFDEVERELTAMSGESMVPNQTLRHINTRVTHEDLVIEIFDFVDEMPCDEGSTEPTVSRL